MASIIRIKRSSVAGNPGTLATGELAYSALPNNDSNGGDRLYIGIGPETLGNAQNHYVIGGKYFTDLLDHTRGTLTASSAIVTDADSKIDNLKVDNLDLNGNTISSTDTNGNIVITPNGTGSIVLDGQNWPQADGTANHYLKTNGSGQLSWAAIPSGSFTIVGDTGTDTFTTGQTMTFTGTDPIDTAITDNTITISIKDATTTTKGAASFAAANFTVTSGAVATKNITLGTSTLTNGSTTLTIAGLQQLDVDNIRVDGNTISSTDTNGNIVLAPNGTGDVQVDADTLRVGDANVAATITTNGTGNLTLSTNEGTSSGTIVINQGANANIEVTPNGTGDVYLNADTVRVGDANVAATITTNGTGNLTLSTNAGTSSGTIVINQGINGNIVLTPSGTGTVDVSGARITSVAEPVNGSDAATKSYVDTVAEGLHVHEAVHCATTGTLASISGGTVTYANGTNGVGATLTLSNGITALDGHTLTNGDRILVKDETNQAHNGIYVRTSATVLTRAADFDTGAEIAGGDFTFVENGTLYGATGWVQIIEVVTVGTDNVIFRQFSGTGTFTAGNGLTISGTEFNVGGTADRISVTADAVDIAATYVGQTSITTLGTVATGTWQATIISPTYGGTGVNNGTKTITLGGNLTTSGSFDTTLTVTASTSVTLPTSGTLATLAGTETLTNKTLTSPTITGGSINNTPIGATTASTGRFTTVSITGIDASSSTTTGALVVAGGVGVGEDIYVAQDIIGAGAATSDLDGFNIDGGTY